MQVSTDPKTKEVGVTKTPKGGIAQKEKAHEQIANTAAVYKELCDTGKLSEADAKKAIAEMQTSQLAAKAGTSSAPAR